MTERSEMRERLEDVHSFPGPFTFKVIGTNSPEFISRVVDAAVEVIGDECDPAVDTRESSGGKHVSVTLEAEVDSADVVMDVYEAFSELDEVRFVM